MSLRSDANLVRNATQVDPPENDEARIGGLFQDIADISETVSTLTQLKAYADASVGDYVYVRGHTVEGVGGGLYQAKEFNDFTASANYASWVGEESKSFTNNYTLELIDGSKYPWAFANNAITSRILWESGAEWDAAQYIDSDKSTGNFTHVSGSVTSGDKGVVLPNVEGLRVIPTYSGYSQEFYWERVMFEDFVTFEMFGAQTTTDRDDTSTFIDCRDAIQEAFRSKYSIKVLGGNYYTSGTIYAEFQKDVIGTGHTIRQFLPDADQQNRRPLRFEHKHSSIIFTDQNIRMFDVWDRVNFQDITFSTRELTSTPFTEEILNYNLSFTLSKLYVTDCGFHGNRDTLVGAINEGGTAIRFNSDEADNTVAEVDGGDGIDGYIFDWVGTRLDIENFRYGHLIDPINNGTSPISGRSITTSVNTNQLNAKFEFCKQACRWLSGSINKISGTYFQDNKILMYEERNTPAFYFRNGFTAIDMASGDHRTSAPTENDDVNLGGSVTYPQAHYDKYIWDTNGNVQFYGRAYREVTSRKQVELGSVPYRVDNQPIASLTNYAGDNVYKRENGGHSFRGMTENEFWYIDAREGVTFEYEALDATGVDLENTTTKQIGTLSSAAGVTLTNFDNIFTPTGLSPTITFGGSADTANDIVEIYLEVPFSSGNIRTRNVYFSGTYGFRQIQCIVLDESDTVLSNRFIDISAEGKGSDGLIELCNGNLDASRKFIFRLIGGYTDQNTKIDTFTHKSYFQQTILPFVPISGGRFFGNVEADSLTLSDSYSTQEKVLTTSVSSSDILNSNTTPIDLTFEDFPVIKSAWLTVTGGSTDYSTNTTMVLRVGQFTGDYLSIDLSDLSESNRYIPLSINKDSDILKSTSAELFTFNGDPTDGDKSFDLNIVYLPLNQ